MEEVYGGGAASAVARCGSHMRTSCLGLSWGWCVQRAGSSWHRLWTEDPPLPTWRHISRQGHFPRFALLSRRFFFFVAALATDALYALIMHKALRPFAPTRRSPSLARVLARQQRPASAWSSSVHLYRSPASSPAALTPKAPARIARLYQMPLLESRLGWRSYSANAEKLRHGPLGHRAFVALGSNLGDRIAMIEQACNAMESKGDIRILRTSSLWETKPMYVEDQGSFVNGACEVSANFLFCRVAVQLQLACHT